MMRRSGPWLLAGLLVAVALVVAFVGTRSPDEPPGNAAEAIEDAATFVTMEQRGAASSNQAPSGLAAESHSQGARLLSDTDGARRNILGMSIRDAGHPCPDVRSAEPLEPGGNAWRVTCGGLRLYWIEIDEFGKLSVEPGAYDESGFGPGNGTGERTLTIRPDELPEAQ